MANLPTAYASQRFGNKTLDFYAAAGEVIGSDPRARADERRLQDIDGARHAVRLMEAKFDLEPGDQASVLRLQPGPARRSRPVAVVNHTRGGWTRTHPGASGLLSRAGVARNVNWGLTMGLFALAALACVWPYLIAFLAEIAPGAVAGIPAPDVFALAAAAAPGLDAFSVAGLTAPLAEALAPVSPALEGMAPALAFGAAAVAGAALVFAARSWRLLWAPLYVAALGAGAMGFGGAQAVLAPALAGLGLAAAVFVIGGAWNRITDAMRLESRIALLADHLISNAPEETVTGSRDAAETDADAAAEAAQDAEPDAAPAGGDSLVDERTAVSVAATLRTLDDDDAPQGETPDDDTGGDDTAGDATAGADAASELDVPHADAAQSEPDADAGADAVSADEAEDAVEAEAEQNAEQDAGAHGEEAPADAEPGAAAEEHAEAGLAEAPAPEPAGEVERADPPTPTGLDQEEAERLRTDPRYAARAIILPPPPPMPAPSTVAADPAPGQGEAPPALEPAGAEAQATRTLNPGKPLPDNVVPIFAAPPPKDD